jgi:hypothetical protein
LFRWAPAHPKKVVLYAKSLHASAIHCTPSYAIYLADYVHREAKIDPRELGIKKFVCGAEPGAGIPAVRAKIAEEWGARVTEGLGNADMVPIIFGECPDQSGMHNNGQEYVYTEIINPENGEVLPIETGVRRICVSFLGAHRAREQEIRIKKIIEQQYPDHFLGSAPVLAGSDISKSSDDMTRTYCALINAYTHGAEEPSAPIA